MNLKFYYLIPKKKVKNYYEKFIQANKKLDSRVLEDDFLFLSQKEIELKHKLEKISAKKEELIKPYLDDKNKTELDLIKILKEKGLKTYKNIQFSTRLTKKVNPIKVLNVLGGDIDNFMLMVTITQIELEKQMKDDAFASFKKELKNCIEVIDEKIIGIKFKKENE